MQLFVLAVFVVVKLNLLAGVDGFVDDFYIEEQRGIFRLVPIVYRINILYMTAEILVGHRTKLFNEFF